MMMFFLINQKIIISVDTYVEGVHFFDFKNPALVIKKDFEIIYFRFNM